MAEEWYKRFNNDYSESQVVSEDAMIGLREDHDLWHILPSEIDELIEDVLETMCPEQLAELLDRAGYLEQLKVLNELRDYKLHLRDVIEDRKLEEKDLDHLNDLRNVCKLHTLEPEDIFD